VTVSVSALIPHYNHSFAVEKVIGALREAGLEVLVVDDASDATHRERLIRMAGPAVRVLHRDVNGGKGAAVLDGLRTAWLNGFTHILQIDADGQHDTGDIPRLLAEAKAHPEAIVTAIPLFDADAPRSRVLGHGFAAFWVGIETLSFRPPDTMCGFRVYPLRPVLALLGCYRPGRRMSFDVEVLVRSNWDGIEIRQLPSRVSYPVDGVSHLRPFRDNLLITLTHVRLLAGMLLRLPKLAARRYRPGGGPGEAGK
jgi:glycosyltransferase involved in cell wall biosynthesis